MAISTNANIDFFGTETLITAGGGTSSVADGAMSVAADAAAWTNADDARQCIIKFKCQWATAPTDKTVISIFARRLNIESTNDTPEPSTVNLDQYIGDVFVDGDVGTATDVYLLSDPLPLKNYKTSQEYTFYFLNQSGQTISAGWQAWVTPLAIGPHA